jgi:hypothetical protein
LENVKVVNYGIGVIGQKLVTHLLEKEGVEIVGAIDINPKIVGRTSERSWGSKSSASR